ncbi:glioma pathogenesis-related protein 1-like [Apus apus]|uniref:glioma pathogenesis-related protein 1-like n=1 Tax=Apus apus TaxID=8895 RepID=UPI0021F88299|nr:glioma pathogenesis-related protein 1-like [Apus apus]
MRVWAVVLALWPVLGPAAALSPALPSITDKTFIEDCVRIHNDLRTKVQPPASNMHYMTWDAALARTARAWSKRCLFKHNIYLGEIHQCHPNFTSIGENIWTGGYQIFTVDSAIKSWYNEVKFYTYADQKCTKVCGHYTQVVWDNSYKVGCAVTFCKAVGGARNVAHFVCNYAPSGNYPRKPYVEGRSCSNCGKGDTCENKLCRNQERDKIIYYSRWYPPWDFMIVCDEACLALVALRILLMLLAFVAVCFFKKRFTSMHMST